MEKGGGPSSAEGTSAARGPGTCPPEFFLFLACLTSLICTFEVSFTIIIGLRHV